MPLTCIITTSKPDNVPFFPNASLENLGMIQDINDWTKSQPGFISREFTNPDENTVVVTVVFDTVNNYIDWRTNHFNLPGVQLRAAYNTDRKSVV